MLTEDFGFAREPFAIKPDPELVFSHVAFRKVCADILVSHLSQRRGLVLITGAPGVGKSTLLLKLLADRQIAQSCVYLSCRASPSFEVLVDWWCGALGIAEESDEHEARARALVDFLTQHQCNGGSSALLLDDADHLDQVTLDSLRRLAELESGGRPVVQIVLAAQSQNGIASNQEAPFVTFPTRLDPVGPLEVGGYILCRLSGAGYDGPPLFSATAIQRIAQVTQGNPRLVNGLCQEALSIAAAENQSAVSAVMVEQVLQEAPPVPPAEKAEPAKLSSPAAGAARDAASPRVQAQTGLPPEAVWPIPFAAMPGEGHAGQRAVSGRASDSFTAPRRQGMRFAAGLLVGLVLGAAGLSIFKAYFGPGDKFPFDLLLTAARQKLDTTAAPGKPAASKAAADTAVVRKVVIVEQTAEGLYVRTPENPAILGDKDFLPSPPLESESGFAAWLQGLLDRWLPKSAESTETAQKPEG